MADITFRLCKCGVLPTHGRFFNGDHIYTTPFFSKARAREWAERQKQTPPVLLEHLLEESALADTDQAAWDNLSEDMKGHVRLFFREGALSVPAEYWPGAFGQSPEREMRSAFGQNPPDDPDFKCSILGLYAPLDRPGTLDD